MSFKKVKLNYVYFILNSSFSQLNKSKANSLGKLQWKTWALHLQGIVYTESRDS